jgi:glycosyltransferase involved in cell wall biosynthesis
MSAGAPLLAICVPTYNRIANVRALLRCLDEELPAAPGAAVLIADNASTDGTWELLREAAAARPWLQVHRQPRNLGAVGNLQWLIEHAPPGRYLWCFGDDDVIAPGGLQAIVALLRDEAPAWLFLPHVFVDEAGREEQRSPAPGAVERFATSGELYKRYHHWLTFLTASIVCRQGFQEAVAAIETDNAYIPLLWFYRAGLDGPCVVAPAHVVHGSSAISWADRAHDIQTLHFTGLWDAGLRAGLSEEEFGATLDGLYGHGFGFDQWRRQPIERLLEVVARFPQSRGLREFLWRLAVEQRRPDVLPVLQEAARATGDDARARALVQAGEERHAAGDGDGAVERFAAATRLAPTDVNAWNDLAVALHQLARPDAGTYLDTALFVDPDDSDARLNRASVRLARGDAAGAADDARHVLERDPANDAATQLLAEASGADAPGRAS